ncbi:MAG: TetR/AcrR family transcriptional regulator [Caldisericia bacterium]
MTDNLSRLEKKEQTRRRIIDTATEIISAEGINESFIKQVGKAAGVAHGSIFAHFGSREMLISAVLESYILKASNFLSSDNSSTPLETAIESHLRLIGRNEGLYINLIVRKSLLPEKAKLQALQFEMKISSMITHRLKADYPNSDPIIISNMWIGLIYRYLENKELYSPNQEVTTRFGDVLKQFFICQITGGCNE